MKLKAEIAGTEYSISLKNEDGKVRAEVDGREYQLEFRQPEPNNYLIFDDTRIYNCRVELFRDLATVHLRQRNHLIRIIDSKRLRSTESAGGHDHGSVLLVAPMPGKVVRLLVSKGTEVVAGQGILVVEAMKMQNELKSPKSGKVTSLRAEPGATVNAGDVLAVVD